MGLKIGILGTRGIPNRYGGFEHIAGYLASGLVQKGHQVTVYNSSRHPYQHNEWNGVRIVHRFDPENLIGVAGQFIYDLNCLLHARKQHYDIVLLLGYTSSSVWNFLYPAKAIIINNMDGLEWQRTKYAGPVRRFLRYAEKLAVQSCRFHIADSPVIKKYLDNKYNINSQFIAYGAEIRPIADESIPGEYGLDKYAYFLLMARMEPENNIEMILDGYWATPTETRFVVIGNVDGQYGKKLVRKYAHDERVFFTGAIFDQRRIQSLMSYCRLYFHGHSVGGTNPSLLDAMATRCPIAAHSNPFNREILKNNVQYFRNASDVSGLINACQYAHPGHIENNYTAIINNYRWNMIIDQYENYFIECYIKTHGYYPVKGEKPFIKKTIRENIGY